MQFNSSHLVSSRVRVQRVQKIGAVLCYARYDIMHAAYVLLVYEAEAQLCCCRRCCRASVVPWFV